MGEGGRTIHGGIRDVIHESSSGRVQPEQAAHSFGDFMIARGRVSADPETPNDLTVLVEWHSSSEEDHSPLQLRVVSAQEGERTRKGVRIEGIGLAQAGQRVARLGERIELCGGKREGIETK